MIMRHPLKLVDSIICPTMSLIRTARNQVGPVEGARCVPVNALKERNRTFYFKNLFMHMRYSVHVLSIPKKIVWLRPNIKPKSQFFDHSLE